MSSWRSRSPGRSRRRGCRRAGRRSAGCRPARQLGEPRPPAGRRPCPRVRHQLELHPPGGEEVDPALALARPGARGRLAEHLDPVPAQVVDRSVEVVDVERDVVAADVAVARQLGRWSGAEYWNTSKTARPPQRKKCSFSMRAPGWTSRCSRIQSSSAVEGAEGVHVLAAEHVDRARPAPASRSGTVKPTWSSPVRPGSPEFARAPRCWIQSDPSVEHVSPVVPSDGRSDSDRIAVQT